MKGALCPLKAPFMFLGEIKASKKNRMEMSQDV